MRPGRKLLMVLGIVIVVAAAALFYMASNLEAIVKAAIERHGSRATGTDVAVASVRISIREGAGAIGGIRIGNPSGFSAPTAFDFEDISIEIDTGSVRRDPVVIKRVRISAPRVVYEIDESGKANINAIRENLDRYGRRIEPEEEKRDAGGRHVLIRDLVIENGHIEIRLPASLNKTYSAPLPSIQLTDVGGEGGATPGGIALQVLRPLAAQAAQSAARTGIRQYLGKSVEDMKRELEKEAEGKIGDAGKKAAEEAEGTLKKFLGR
jgi:uncharacterized protein involved in outer membrane biogenesis